MSESIFRRKVFEVACNSEGIVVGSPGAASVLCGELSFPCLREGLNARPGKDVAGKKCGFFGLT